jgi:hypothetical protein
MSNISKKAKQSTTKLITGENILEFLGNLEKALEELVLNQLNTTTLELQMDKISNLDLQSLEKIIKILESANNTPMAKPSPKPSNSQFPKIIRVASFGQKVIYTHAEIEILQKCLQAQFDYVEINFKTACQNCIRIKNPLDKPKKKKNQALEDLNLQQNPRIKPNLDLSSKNSETKIILTHNNPSKTDSYQNLRKIQKRMKGLNCNVQKFVCNVQDDEDNIILTRLLTSKTKSEKMIIQVVGNRAEFINNIAVGLGSLVIC